MACERNCLSSSTIIDNFNSIGKYIPCKFALSFFYKIQFPLTNGFRDAHRMSTLIGTICLLIPTRIGKAPVDLSLR